MRPYVHGADSTSIFTQQGRAHTYTHTQATLPPFPSLAGRRRGCGACVGDARGRSRRARGEQAGRGTDKDEGIGRTLVGWEGSARPGWHLNPPHVVDLMEGCRSPIRRTGERTRTRAPASNLLHVSTPGSLATTISGTSP